jgi:murein L,D-transpeptidase YcbB/YkuD
LSYLAYSHYFNNTVTAQSPAESSNIQVVAPQITSTVETPAPTTDPITIDDLPLEDISIAKEDTFLGDDSQANSPTVDNSQDEPLAQNLVNNNTNLEAEPINDIDANTATEMAGTAPHLITLDSILASNKTDQRVAISALFNRWQKNYDANSKKLTCTQSAAFSLLCLEKVGNINTLKQLNRPAILTLTDQNNNTRFITLITLNPPNATIEINKMYYNVTVEEINKYWYGKFILFWQKPKMYHAAVLPKSKSKLTPWLRQQLNFLGATVTPTKSLLYDEKLVTLVKDFQAQAHLNSDGIVGPMTIIQLNTLTPSSVPKLQP